MTDTVAATVIRIIAEQAQLAVSEVRMESTPDALGLESLGLVEMVFAIEEAFDIQVPFNASANGPQDFDMSTVATVVAAVHALVAARAQSKA